MNIKSLFFTVLTVFTVCFSYGQEEKIQAERKRIFDEAISLYRLEKASWHATDLLMHDHKNILSEVKGYLSYADNKETKTIFWNAEKEIVFFVAFDSIASNETGILSTNKRESTSQEKDLIQLRTVVYTSLIENKDKFFKFYEKTSANIIPMIKDGVRTVFVLSASQGEELLIGNDYKIVFNEKNEVIQKTTLHKSLIKLDMKGDEKNRTGSFHTHILEDQPLMTSTDICTYLLYKDVFKLSDHTVISENWISIFNASKMHFIVVPNNASKKK